MMNNSEGRDLQQDWGARLVPVVCEQCDWRYLLPAGSPAQLCPNCFQQELAGLDPAGELEPYPYPPELVLPFTLDEEKLAQAVVQFARNIPFAPKDLNPALLKQRLRRVYVPAWLVDAQVTAQFQAEVGFDYQAVSHREKYAGSSWQTQEVQETRIRWEPRVGRLQRPYQNVPAPALEVESRLQRRLGEFDQARAVAYEPVLLGQTFVHLPNRQPADAWSEALPGFQARAAEECRLAAEAQHIRDFRWSAAFAGQNWAQWLRPVYSTFYLDDEGRPRPVLVHGQSGRIDGERRASRRRAQTAAMWIGGFGVGLFVLAVLLGLAAYSLSSSLLALLAVLMVVLAFVLVAGALIPPLVVWRFNRRQAQRPD